jgi:hypothetical protein
MCFCAHCTTVLLAKNPQAPPPPPAFGLIYSTRALLVGQDKDRRHLSVTPCSEASLSHKELPALKNLNFFPFLFSWAPFQLSSTLDDRILISEKDGIASIWRITLNFIISSPIFANVMVEHRTQIFYLLRSPDIDT